MLQNFKDKKSKDIEFASETIISNLSFTNTLQNNIPLKPVSNATSNQVMEENFDALIEKKNKN